MCICILFVCLSDHLPFPSLSKCRKPSTKSSTVSVIFFPDTACHQKVLSPESCFKKLVGINFFSDRSNHQSLVIYAIMRNVSVKILSDFSIISQRIHSTILHNLRSVTHLEEREEGFEGDASIGASLAVCGLHQLLHVTLRRVLAQRA